MPAPTKPQLLERDAELDELQAALEDARRGTGRLVIVEGPAGIGKTRLLAVARGRASRCSSTLQPRRSRRGTTTS